MEKQQVEEWRILQEEAIRTLRDNDRQDGTRVLQLLTVPPFESTISHEIHETRSPRHVTKHLGIITCWRRDIDISKFRTPLKRLKYPASLTPTIERQSFEMTAEEVEETLDGFRSISIPVLVGAHSLGLDGTTYEIKLEFGLLQSHFRWWNEPPAEWQILKVVFQDTLAKLNALAASQRGENTDRRVYSGIMRYRSRPTSLRDEPAGNESRLHVLVRSLPGGRITLYAAHITA